MWIYAVKEIMTRPLQNAEKDIILRIAERLPEPRRQHLLDDLGKAEAESFPTEGADRIVFTISGYERPPYHGQHSIGVDVELADQDGTKIYVDLYADENDRLLELEFIRCGEGNLIGPDWRTLRIR